MVMGKYQHLILKISKISKKKKSKQAHTFCVANWDTDVIRDLNNLELIYRSRVWKIPLPYGPMEKEKYSLEFSFANCQKIKMVFCELHWAENSGEVWNNFGTNL